MTLVEAPIQVVIANPLVDSISDEILNKYVTFVNWAFRSKSKESDYLFGEYPRLHSPNQIIEEVGDGTLFTAYTTEDINRISYTSEIEVNSNGNAPPATSTILATMAFVKDREESKNSGREYYRLRLVAVNPDLWRSGLGAKLLGVLEQTLSSSIKSTSILIADCVRDVGNDEYYKKRGFMYKAEEKSQPNQWGSTRPFTLIRMEKVIAPQ